MRVYALTMVDSDRMFKVKLFKTKKSAFEYSKEIANLPEDISQRKFYKKIEHNPLNNNHYEWSFTDYNGGYNGDEMVFYNYYIKSEPLIK